MLALSEIEGFSSLLTENALPGTPPSRALAEGFQHNFAQMSWQVLPSYCDRLHVWLSPMITRDDAPIFARAKALRLFFEIQNHVLVEVSRHFKKIGLDHCLLKGAANRFDLYPTPSDRGGIDLDFAIPEALSTEGRRVAHDLGFVQSAWDEERRIFVQATDSQRRWIDENHYELGFLIRRHAVEHLSPEQEEAIRGQLHLQPNPWHVLPDGGLGVWINLDLHTGLSHDIPVYEIMQSGRTLEYLGTSLPVPSRAWELFHIVYKLYWEGVFNYGKGVYQFADICRLVPRLDEQDSLMFIELVERWRLAAAAVHILRQLPRSFNIAVEGPLQEFVGDAAQPARGTKPEEENNFGDVWSKIWGYR